MDIGEFKNFLQKHKLAENSAELAKMAHFFQERKRSGIKVIHCKEPMSWDEH